MLHMTVLKVNMKNIEWDKCLCEYYIWLFKVNMKNIEWGRCLCKCYIWLFWKWIWETLSEVGVYVNVTYDCSQSEYEKYWVR
jgi:hypothetical protein